MPTPKKKPVKKRARPPTTKEQFSAITAYYEAIFNETRSLSARILRVEDSMKPFVQASESTLREHRAAIDAYTRTHRILADVEAIAARLELLDKHVAEMHNAFRFELAARNKPGRFSRTMAALFGAGWSLQ